MRVQLRIIRRTTSRIIYLPNNLQRHAPIMSLRNFGCHQGCLYVQSSLCTKAGYGKCETWCSRDKLDRAKTVDLCQKPLTKEPKLARARQIPEWEQYDAKIARRRLTNEGRSHASTATADVNELARLGPPRSPFWQKRQCRAMLLARRKARTRGKCPLDS
ncbi:hypothetical protein EDB86DRAFT_2322826 [Lactarius hatsudake]|nr:hypothetical protein EDB86DRAFT_2322826 [Lactarius hatsudake]